MFRHYCTSGFHVMNKYVWKTQDLTRLHVCVKSSPNQECISKSILEQFNPAKSVRARLKVFIYASANSCPSPPKTLANIRAIYVWLLSWEFFMCGMSGSIWVLGSDNPMLLHGRSWSLYMINFLHIYIGMHTKWRTGKPISSTI